MSWAWAETVTTKFTALMLTEPNKYLFPNISERKVWKEQEGICTTVAKYTVRKIGRAKVFEVTIRIDEEHAEELIQLGKRIIEAVEKLEEFVEEDVQES
jgi:hypothetical protein